MDEAMGARFSSNSAKFISGPILRVLRGVTTRQKDTEPAWRKRGDTIKSGYQPTWQER